MKAVFLIQAPDQVCVHWQRVTEMLRKHFPTAVPVMDPARDDVLDFLHFPQEHWRKIWSTNALEWLNVAPRGALGRAVIKPRTNVVGISSNDAAFVLLVGSQLMEQREEWHLERRPIFSEATIARNPEPDEALELTDAHPPAHPAATTSLSAPAPPSIHRTHRSLSCQFSDQGS